MAFAHRLGLNKLNDQTLLMRIITHPSYERVGIRTNEGLDILGKKVMEMYVLEHLHVKYPKLPLNTLEEAVQVYTRAGTLTIMGKEFGVDDVARWVHSKPDAGHQLAVSTIRASVVRAVVGAIYADQGPLKAREFVHAHFLSREFDLASLLKIDDPKLHISFLMKRLGRERPVARMLAETGRQSKAPVFIVGVYSGTEKLGEGFGHSIAMAEFRANKDALTKYYMEELKDFSLPSDVEKEGFIYTPTRIGDTQVVV
ncbi:ribonuclease III domain-containing protein [Mortierella sp. GBAus27b]|nr:ribonuclease III domain-containing protein [Mortierella sp. GBAus27b]